MVRFPSPQTPGRFKKIQKSRADVWISSGNFLGQSQPANISRKTQGTVQRRRSTSCLCAVVLNNVCPRWSNGSSTKIPTFCRKKMEAVSFGGFFSCKGKPTKIKPFWKKKRLISSHVCVQKKCPFQFVCFQKIISHRIHVDMVYVPTSIFVDFYGFQGR